MLCCRYDTIVVGGKNTDDEVAADFNDTAVKEISLVCTIK
jgi:hypothetical protein